MLVSLLFQSYTQDDFEGEQRYEGSVGLLVQLLPCLQLGQNGLMKGGIIYYLPPGFLKLC